MLKKKIAILGAGAWGKALAKIFAQNHDIIICSRNINSNDLRITNDNNKIYECDIIFIALPAQEVRKVCKQIQQGANLNKDSVIVIGSKGIECSTLLLLSEVIYEELNHNNIAVISGPNFSHEIQLGLPSSATLACRNKELLSDLKKCLSVQGFSLHKSTDIIGVQIFSAVKNVIAIACGIFHGMKLGNNIHAALITFGLKEITRLCVAKNGNPDTALELCGVGDLILTCSSPDSRNVSFGIELSRGILPHDILARSNTVEGFYTVQTVQHLSQILGIEMPICSSIYNIIYNKAPFESEVKKILSII